jgi:hypothetical protein
MSKKIKGPKKDLRALAFDGLGGLRRYAVLLFFLLIAAVYGFVLYRINTLSSAQPTPDAVTAQLKTAATPHIDQTVVKQVENLQDNSVSVQALFDQARSNPFQE